MLLVVWQTRAENFNNYAQSSHEQLQRVNNYVEVFFQSTENNAEYRTGMPETLAARDSLPR